MVRRLALGDNAPDTLELLKGMGVERAAARIRSSSMPVVMKEAIYAQIPGLKAEVERQKAEEVVHEYENKQASTEQSTPVWPYLLGGSVLLWILFR